MKIKGILPAALLATTLIVPAGYAKGGLCKQMYKTSYIVETARQRGVPAYVVMDKLNEQKLKGMPTDLKKVYRGLMRSMVLDAYDKVRMPTEGLQKMQEEEFANQQYLDCEKGMGK